MIRITTRNRDRALKVPRDCLTIQKKIAATRMATMGITQMPPMSTAKALSRDVKHGQSPVHSTSPTATLTRRTNIATGSKASGTAMITPSDEAKMR